ncbi:hypothetical protein Taro_018140 [Colocasia esculenta]|uniref:Senataxin n=1 Tax=Colocasia esculenta TaxID=4460 RepID=A0A843UQ51_COLES|nr:hypothetical protein [Colocasia esculenta]
MAMRTCSRRELLDRLRAIQDAEAEDDDEWVGGGGAMLSSSRQRVQQFADAFNFLILLPKETHIWCGCWELMGPLLETFHDFLNDKSNESPLKLLWKRVSQELGQCTQCVCQYHQTQETYNMEYEPDTVGPLLKTLQCLDEERIVEHLKEMNARFLRREYDPEFHSSEVVSIMFEVLMFPTLLDGQLLVNEFQVFIEAIDNSHELELSGQQQYPGLYALLFLKSCKARAIGLRLVQSMGKLRSLRFCSAPAFEEGILERYPIFLSIILNHVSDDTPEFSYAVTCLKLLFEMLGCKLWLRTTLSPSVMRNTLLGQSFHTRNEKSHKEIFDLFSLEALQDGEHEKQRRHLLYFLLHQVTQSNCSSYCTPGLHDESSFSTIRMRTYVDSSLHSSLRQPAFDLMQTIIVSDAAALVSLTLKYHTASSIDMMASTDFNCDEDDITFLHDAEEVESSCWSEFSAQQKLTSQECRDWRCVPMLWLDVLVEVDPFILPISFSKAVMWSLSHFSVVNPDSNVASDIPVRDWLATYAGEILNSLGWEVPSGSDDGGEGRESKCSVKATSMCIPLIRAFKRCAMHFVMQMKQRELQKQFIWEPKMAESLILQAGRVILEHVSKTHGLTPGLQFLCSSISSLSAMYLGLKYALRQVQLNSSLSFCNLHHLFFIVHKLLKEVESSQKTATLSGENLNDSKFISGGGFLRQPCFGYSPVTDQGCSLNIMDKKSWEIFSSFISAIAWPFILECLSKGKEFFDDKSCQMTCVRLLEIIPVAFERIHFSASKLPQKFKVTISRIFNFKWLSDLADWGKSSLIVIIRRWKQSILSLLTLIKDSSQVNLEYALHAIEPMMYYDTVAVDELKEKLSQLSLMLCKEALGVVEKKPSTVEPLHSEHYSLGRKPSVSDISYPEIKDICTETFSIFKREEDKVIVLSDDETEKVPSSAMVTFPSSKSSQYMLEKKVSAHKDSLSMAGKVGPTRATVSQDAGQTSSSNSAMCSISTSQKHRDHVLDKCVLSSEIVSPEVRGIISSIQSECTVEKHGKKNANKSSSFKKVDSVLIDSSVHSVPQGKLNQVPATRGNEELEKRVDSPKNIIYNAASDPLESAFNYLGHQAQLTKSSISVPKRKIIQLEMPVNSKHGLLNRMDARVRRLKPPKLDDWYRPILEIDYFSLVGLSSDSDGVNGTVARLKEVPLSFVSSDHYIEIFRPLVLEEFKAQLHSSFLEASSSDDMPCGKVSILSVERIDDFYVVRARPEDSESARACSENDLVLLTKEPLENSVQRLHVVGKVERREKADKSRSLILVIRFYLHNGSSRLNKVYRLLIERSKWYVSRIMSMTPQLREFQALSSLNDIPMLPVILRPTDCSPSFNGLENVELDRLSPAMQKTLRSNFNSSQLQAIGVAIGTQGSKRSFELSLIQGPPGTGKTRTIVAIVSAFLALSLSNRHGIAKELNKNSRQDSSMCSIRTRISQSAAIARAWQDAAYAKQMIRDEEEVCSRTIQKSARGRVLICAQSNAAVDELVSRIKEGLYGDDGKMYKPYLVRVGNVKAVHPNSLPFFIDTLVEERLAEDKSHCDTKNDVSADSSTLQTRLEKLVESIRLYESKRAKLRDDDRHQTDFPEDGSSKMDCGDMSDTAIESKLNILYGQKKAMCVELAVAQARDKKFTEENKFIRQKIRKSVLREAEIVVTTLSGCGGDIYGACFDSASHCKLGNFSEQSLFDAVIIDEAAQALEPATLIPLQLLKSNGTKCVMVGDPKQLPATVLSSVASKFLYECSMFERMQRAGYPVVMLTEQYRMHPEICRFPSTHFYEDKLLNGLQMASKLAPFHESAYLGPYMFFDVIDGRESHGKKSGSLSLYNESEADAAIEIIKIFIKRYSSEFASGRIGVITPYKGQLSLLRSRFSNAIGPSITSDIEFNTVDGFQGREVDILLLSTVRASVSDAKEQGNNSSSIGFVADVRRMNVALTRARFSLWIVGNARTLQTNLHWHALVKSSKERNLFMSVSRPYGAIFQNSPCFPMDLKSHLLEVNLKQQKKVNVKDARHINQSAKLNAKEGQQRKTSVNNEGKRHRSGLMHDHGLKKSGRVSTNIDLSSGGLLHGLKNEEPSMKRRIMRKDEDNQIDIPRNKDESSSSKHIAKARPIGNKVRSKANPASGQMEMDSSIKDLLGKAKRVHETSDRSIPYAVNSAKAAISNTSNEGTHKGKKPEGKGRLDGPEDSRMNMISRRKRQRDAVDALLASALISSKKPEIFYEMLTPGKRQAGKQ